MTPLSVLSQSSHPGGQHIILWILNVHSMAFAVYPHERYAQALKRSMFLSRRFLEFFSSAFPEPFAKFSLGPEILRRLLLVIASLGKMLKFYT